ncbi:MAG: bifunctional aldolase/short-chain dehydrogenase [Verrucomicrobiae bacterium]|nr:bifunctional aldolase/short-chain dehydrogenase [Verrucomicrobiae bacterium]MCP5542232.1 bifunctional aldolase/short-chain dehydrogenase [Akkermansiaceae bacterium]
MKSLWSDTEAKKFAGALGRRVYTSRLLGANPELVLHGGGNTSVKVTEKDFFGDPVDVLYVKGSGWDLATIEAAGFAPVRMEALLKMAKLKALSDAEMVKQQRAAMLDPGAPNPSIEAILHAVIPQKVVDHTHANAVVALTNHKGGRESVEEVYGDRMVVIPYVMPGFELALAVAAALSKTDPRSIDGLILMNHGIFTFHDDARRSYELMIEHVSRAEAYLSKKCGKAFAPPKSKPAEDLSGLAEIRRQVSKLRGVPVIASLDASPEAVGFSARPDVAGLATRGPLTPDHTIRTKRAPVVIGDDIGKSIGKFADDYAKYFQKHQKGETMLTPDPRWAVWPGKGVVSFGATEGEAGIVRDIATHTWRTIQVAEAAFDGGWKPLPASKLFDIEYWELEQAKLRKSGSAPVHRGKVAIVTGSAAGIGFACAETLAEQGAKVIGIDLSPEIEAQMEGIGGVGIVANLTEDAKVVAAVEETVRRFGGLDIVVSNAGIFTAGAYLEDLESSNWDKSMAVNLTSHQKLLKHTIPYLKKGVDPAIVLVGSRNVNAPGAGAASYSCAKAGLTQLCRVASLELAPFQVRCNIIHPDAVFDTKLWTPEALQRSAERYGLTVEEYKTRNLMKTEIKSKDVGRMVAAMASPLFGKTTGAQIPVDGGNDRVI